MKCPKYIKELCMKRARAASKFLDYDWDIAQWLDDHNISVEECDIRTGCESLCNPFPSSRRIIEAIENYEGEQK